MHRNYHGKSSCSICACSLVGQNAFHLNDELWTEAMDGYDGFAHIKCIETKLGRGLVRSDFSNAPINMWMDGLDIMDYIKVVDGIIHTNFPEGYRDAT